MVLGMRQIPDEQADLQTEGAMPQAAREQIPLSAEAVATREAPCNRGAVRGNRTATNLGKVVG